MKYGTDYIKLREKVIKTIDLVEQEHFENLEHTGISAETVGSVYNISAKCVACTALKMLVYEEKVINYNFMNVMTKIGTIRSLIDTIAFNMDIIQDAKAFVLEDDNICATGVYDTITEFLIRESSKLSSKKGYALGRYGEHGILVVGRTANENGSKAKNDFKLIKIRVEEKTAHYIFRDIDGHFVYAIKTPDNCDKIRKSGLEIVE